MKFVNVPAWRTATAAPRSPSEIGRAQKRSKKSRGNCHFPARFGPDRWLPLRFRPYWPLVPARPGPPSNLEIPPYRGPASACGMIARAEAAYFQMLNDEGGVNGRKTDFLTLDDAYSAAKTVEQMARFDGKSWVLFGDVPGEKQKREQKSS
jgi:hypothetical protein